MAQDIITVGGTEVLVSKIITVPVDVVEHTVYSGETAEFDVDAVCDALGITDIAEAAQYIVNVTDNTCVSNDDGYDGWRDWQGDAAFWDTGDGMVCVKLNYPEEGLIDYIGCIDETWDAGDEYVALWGFVANDRAVIVKVVITFVEDSSVPAPEAELDLSKIEVVGMAECSTERYSYQGYETEECTVSVPGMDTLLGVEATDMEDWFEDAVYVAYNNANGIKVDSLQLLYATDGWLQRTCEDWGELGAGDMLDECCASQWSGTVTYFIQDLYYNPATDVVSFNVGNYQGNIEEGDELYADLYVMNGAKAFVIRHNLLCVEAPAGGGPESMTKVGEQVIEITQYPTADYSYSYIYPNLDEAAALLGCDASNLSLNALSNATTFATYSTANQGGWWFDENGYVANWGSSPVFIEPEEAGEYSALHIGQMPDLCDEGDVYNIPLYLVYGDSYYLLSITLTIIPETPIDWGGAESVSTTTLTIRQELDADYVFSASAGIAFSKIEEAIGITDPTLVGELTPEEALENDGVQYTKDYTCTPYPGFWLTQSGYVTSWGDNSYWGMSIAYEGSSEELLFNCCQFPGLTVDGDTYNGTFYLLNPESMKMMTVKLTYIIGHVTEYENVGDEDMAVPVSEEECELSFNQDEILEALGATEDEFYSSYCMCASYGYTSTVTPQEGLSFDLTGACVANGEGLFGFWIENGKMYTYAQEDIPEGTNITVTVYIQLNERQYTLNITFMTPDGYDEYLGVEGVEADTTASAAVYDLSGRRVAEMRKGIYIQNGKKTLVK